MANARNIYLTDQDMARLRALVSERHDDRELEPLIDELDRALVVPQELIPPNVVTMNSVVRFEDINTREITEATVVYPQHADPKRGRISILAPVGAALIGLTVGDAIDWPLPGGRVKQLRVLAVVYQPEASGAWDL